MGQSGPGSNGNKASGLEPHHQMQFNVISMSLFEGRGSYTFAYSPASAD